MSASWTEPLSAWPMCSTPVTFGGGSAIEKFSSGVPAGSGWCSPEAIQRSAMRGSTSAGSKRVRSCSVLIGWRSVGRGARAADPRRAPQCRPRRPPPNGVISRTSPIRSRSPAMRRNSARSSRVSRSGCPCDLRVSWASRVRSDGDRVRQRLRIISAASKRRIQGTLRRAMRNMAGDSPRRGARNRISPDRRARPAAGARSGRRRSGGLGGAPGALLLRRGLGDERRPVGLLDPLARHGALLDVAAGGQLELDLEQDLLEDRPQAAGAGLALERLVGDRRKRVLGEDELDAVEGEEPLELLHERVARLGEDRDEVVARELVDGAHDGEAADELGDEPVVDEVLGQRVLEHLTRVALDARLDRRAEADALVADAPFDDLVEVGEGPAADEQDVRRVDREELLVGVLGPALRRHAGGRPLEDLQERLLNALAGHVARDRRVVRLARDLVDLVDVDDPGLGLLDVVVGRLDQLEQDVLDVLADVAGLGQRRRVGDREGDVQDAGERLGEQRLAAAGRAEEQDVRLLQLDVRVVALHHLHALVVVVDRYGERALGLLLADHVLVEHAVDLPRLREVLDVERRGGGELLVDDLVAEIDALVADVDAGTGDQLLDLPLRLAAEAAEQLFIRIGGTSH